MTWFRYCIFALILKISSPAFAVLPPADFNSVPPVIHEVPALPPLDTTDPDFILPPTAVPLGVVMEVEEEKEPADFFTEVLEAVKNLGGVPFMMQLSLILALIVSSFKVTVIRDVVWSKLGPAKVWVAPGLALVAGILGLGADGTPITPALVLAYVSAGGGAVFVHEALDSVKKIPKIGDKYGALLTGVQKLLVKGRLAKKK